jgi:Flp pilus assembly pilin Flp
MSARPINVSRTQAFSLWRDNRGLSTVEYVIILVLIASAAVGTWSLFGQTIRGKLKSSVGEMRDMKAQ